MGGLYIQSDTLASTSAVLPTFFLLTYCYSWYSQRQPAIKYKISQQKKNHHRLTDSLLTCFLTVSSSRSLTNRFFFSFFFLPFVNFRYFRGLFFQFSFGLLIPFSNWILIYIFNSFFICYLLIFFYFHELSIQFLNGLLFLFSN